MQQKYLLTTELEAKLAKIDEIEKQLKEFREDVDHHFDEEHLSLARLIDAQGREIAELKRLLLKERLGRMRRQINAIKELDSE